jgi:peptidoglycan/xylan/chitin deacetylase (PgdA/CDA1 family)
LSTPPAARRIVRLLQIFVPPRRSHSLTILAYHLIGGRTSSPVDIPSADFENHLESLARSSSAVRFSIGTGQLTERPESPRSTTAVTFDDAFANFKEEALPLLERYEIPALLYVPVGFVNGASRSPLHGAEGQLAIGVDDLRSLAQHPLVEIGAHSWTHPDMRKLGVDQFARELGEARDQLEQWTGNAVPHFCYPRALWNRRSERRVRTVYATATIGGGRANHVDTDPMRLQRVSIRRDSAPLEHILRTALWLEEFFADWVRRRRKR